ncbi:gas vesicle protein [Amycolatopsis sp. FBCC-B4732]|uniref:gas vesicle protein GvpJ n=1 Tax=Amycolatopsis sp. FBCC-B4732 TaxID=3079339 RepID=UPI001FF57E69|nr:gas vesicle protein GvpJ [Amycolatopsis sp. FBCC-B4732]UOX87934.1 gas vesicle protein [Amycolatopsis sp. FBCC-B4732]
MTRPGQTGGGLADTLDILLDKGLVIDASVRVSVIGIELLAIEARIAIAGVDTCIRYLEAMRRLQSTPVPGQVSRGLGQTTGLIPPPTPAVAVPVDPAVPADQP